MGEGSPAHDVVTIIARKQTLPFFSCETERPEAYGLAMLGI